MKLTFSDRMNESNIDKALDAILRSGILTL